MLTTRSEHLSRWRAAPLYEYSINGGLNWQFSTTFSGLFQGFYDQSLKNINLNIYSNKKASLINIDCDLYESAVPIFDFIDNILQEGTILYIDDYFTGYKGNPTKGVSGALKEWNNNSKWNLESYREVGWAGRSYIVY